MSVELRPVTAQDRARVMEITRDVWGGTDYLPRVFDSWLAEPSGAFEVAEVDGLVVGIHRFRPLAEGIAWYEGLRVARTHRRQGIARTMLAAAVDACRANGFRELRLATGNERARALFEQQGMTRISTARIWSAGRVEGGDPPRIPGPESAPALLETVTGDSGTALYGGVNADGAGARDLNLAELRDLARGGHLRTLTGARALAVVKEAWAGDLRCTFLAGRSGHLRDLLTALRFEADSEGLDSVSVRIPAGHPAENDLEAVGYALGADGTDFHLYRLTL